MICKMDAFLADAFDLSPDAAPPPDVLSADGMLMVDNMLLTPALHTNLAFHVAWRAAIGVSPTRADYWNFRTRNGASALTDCIIDCTPVRAVPKAQEILKTAQAAYARALSALGGGDKDVVKAELLAKIADRSCLEPAAALQSVSGMGLVAAYAELLMKSKSCILEFEAWARAVSGKGVSAPPPASVPEYYSRSASVMRALDMWSSSLVTDVTFDAPERVPPFVSCIEVMRMAVTRDGYLWRRDAGGAMLVARPPLSAKLVEHGFGFRTVQIPWRILRACLPAGMYGRFMVEEEEDGDCSGVFDGVPQAIAASADIVPLVRRCPEPTSRALLEKRRIVVATPDPPPAASSSLFWLPTAGGALGGMPWSDALYSAMLTSHMLLPADNGLLTMQQFVVRYMHERGLATRRFSEVLASSSAAASASAFGEVVVVDSRPNVWSLASVLVTLDNLDAARWAVTVFTSSAARDFWERNLVAHHVPAARVEVLPELDKAPFDLERYNVLLKSPAFWDRIGAPRALVVQDDGMLVRPGLEAEFADVDYVGSPWVDAEANAALKQMVPSLVGNGGMSLRNVSVMREICARAGKEARRLFNSRMQPVPEDVFFASEVAKRQGGRPCPRPAAERFATEQVASPVALGFHKPWAYLPEGFVRVFFKAALDEATERRGG